LITHARFDEIEQTLVRDDGVRITFWQHRAPTSQGVLLFIHGVASNHTRFSEFLNNTVLTHSWDTLRLDLRGHALSVHRGKIGTDVWCADLCALLDACGYARVVLAGHSLGANVAVQFAQRYAAWVAGLILIDPAQPKSMYWGLPRAAACAVVNVVAGAARLLAAIGVYRRKLPALDLERLDQQARALLTAGRDADMERLYSSAWEDLRYFPTATYLQDVLQVLQSAPTSAPNLPALMLLSVRGRDAGVALNRAYAARLPRCTVVEIKCNHWILTAAADAARVAIEQWLTRVELSVDQ